MVSELHSSIFPISLVVSEISLWGNWLTNGMFYQRLLIFRSMVLLTLSVWATNKLFFIKGVATDKRADEG